ncbi:DUF2333 family protein [Halochromatium glycolicum]|uniref:Uncharacterized protein n=1 Tax=Halochromatium glycolicum TaxID=85075 RepID=A0AAJ0U3K7_9GAMM|nr:DUF2333 family protein [Halochromatium glycolicum]MBK1704597.1 hypothetical protein [Halochromatium glycolicum]
MLFGPSCKCGVIMALCDALRALRNDFSRAQTQSVENLDLKRADLQFAIDPKFWIMPAAEDEYQKRIEALKGHLHAMDVGRRSPISWFLPHDPCGQGQSVPGFPLSCTSDDGLFDLRA